MNIVGRPSPNLLLDLSNPLTFSPLSWLYHFNVAYSDRWDGLKVPKHEIFDGGFLA
jgi:hypothetical protein